ncbi:MAG: MFS transporter [Candidatus Hermodarchaeia archaeon]|jgi:DHA1 family putative efflux transporter-like MFS transporter
MDEESIQTQEKSSVGRLFLPSLVLSRFATTPRGIIMSLLLIEIGLTFGLPVGVTGQLGTAGSIAAFVSSLLMGILTIRYKHKSLLMTGLLLLSVALLGSSQAPNFILLLMFTVLAGLGGAMVMPMTTTLVAKHLPLKKRPGALGLLMATLSVSFLIGSPAISYISDIGGWRLAFLVYALPFPLLGFLLDFKGLPQEPESAQTSTRKWSLADGYKGVLSNRSAVACLLGNALSSATFSGITLYSISFYRQNFLVSKGMATYFMIGLSLSYTIGALISSRFVNKLGRKPVTSISVFMTGIFIIFFTIVPNLWLSLGLTMAGCLFAGIRVTANVSLTIEQVPKFRGTVMSISAASANIGSALGSGLGGLALLLYSYEAVGPSLGLLGLASAIIVHLFAVDPTRMKI